MSEARLNVTFKGSNGDLPDPIDFDANDEQVRTYAREAVSSGSIPGIPADPTASFEDFVVDRFEATEARPYNLIQLRPKTPFGKTR